MYCRLSDLSNEASVETFFVIRMLKDLRYKDAQIKTKASLTALTVGRGRRKERYKPDFALFYRGKPRCIVDAKAVDEELDQWIEQCSGYCLALNRKFERSNPVRFFILTNGKTTKVYEWDKDDPILVLDFTDFTWGNPKYEHLFTVVGAENVAKSEAKPLEEQPSTFKFERPTTERARQLFATCHRAIWKSEGYGPGPAFMAFIRLMFVKLWADKNLRDNSELRPIFEQDHGLVILPESMVPFSVRWIEDRESEGAVNPIDSMLFSRLRDGIERDIQLRKKKRIFDKGEQIGLRPDTVKDVVRRLQHYDMFGIDEDLNGRLFETFLNATMRGRELGQFFTPRSVVKMMTSLANLSVTRTHQDTILDACCGSGGFLIEALTAMRNSVRSNDSLSLNEKENLIDTISNSCLYGVDYGKDPPIARIARINMYLHGDGGSRIYYADSLDKTLDSTAEEADPEVVENVQELRAELNRGLLFDVVLTNPPFSMTKEQRNPSERRILQQYQLAIRGKSTSQLRPSLRSSVMFAERYWELLKQRGRLITVIDDTLLSSSLFGYFRDFIREKFLVRAIISLPGDTFRRSGSRVKTSVLLLEKKSSPDDEQPSVFTYFSRYLGVDDLTPRASDADIEEARAKAEQETKHILKGYLQYLNGSAKEHTIEATRINDRLDLRYCVPLFGRMAKKWQAQGVEVRRLEECVRLVEEEITPSAHPDTDFVLIKVTYDGVCEIDRRLLGQRIRAKTMYRVHEGQMVFSTIRATDGAIGIVSAELNDSLVSGSYSVFDCGDAADTAYLWAVLRSHELRADMQSLSPGSGRYTSYWPDVGAVLVPWLAETERKKIGHQLIKTWEMERQVERDRHSAMEKIAALGVESRESIARWESSKAPK